jgi:thiol:disulfide interchange protein DsbD
MIRLLTKLVAFPVLIACLAAGHARAEENFLDPAEAFRFKASALDARTIEAAWKIADGYYLYRNKFKFTLNGAQLGTVQLPPGKTKDDPTFGRVEIYRNWVILSLPVERKPGPALPVTLSVTYQGCAEGGVCYMPITETARIRLAALDAPKAQAAAAKAGDQTASTPPARASQPVAPAPAAEPAQGAGPASQSTAALAGLRTLASDDGVEEEFLPPDEAFKSAVRLKDATTLEVSYTIAPDYYLYRDKLKFALTAPAGVTLGRPSTPTPDVKDDPTFGRTEVYHHDFKAEVPLSRALGADEKLSLEISYQGCSEKGICYPPIDKPFTLAAFAGAPAAPVVSASAAPAAGVPDSGDAASIEQTLKGGGLWVAIVAFFGFGLALSLTPCVFPMIPILSGIIAGQKHVTRTSGFMLSLAYVLGMAITYAVVGVIAAQSGTLLSNALQNPIALGIGAAIFVALALSMFGFYDLQLPSALQSKLTETSNRLHGGHFGGVFGMGALSALIVGPCVAPPLAAALAYIAQTGDSVKGGLSLFFLALGMGVPLLAVGLSAGTLLPKAGAWMNGVKYFFGVAMLGVAIWLISPFLPAWLHMGLWSALLIISAVYLHALDPLPQHAKGWQRLWKGVGVVSLIAGLGLLLGALGGSRDILQPLSVYQGVMSGTATGQPVNTSSLSFSKVKTVAELDSRLAEAKAAGKPVMLDFYADWCVSCKEMEKFTFSDARVQTRLKDAILLKADVTGNSDYDKALLKRFGLFGPPGIIFWDRNGQQAGHKVIGYEPSDKFLGSLDRTLGTP